MFLHFIVIVNVYHSIVFSLSFAAGQALFAESPSISPQTWSTVVILWLLFVITVLHVVCWVYRAVAYRTQWHQPYAGTRNYSVLRTMFVFLKTATVLCTGYLLYALLSQPHSSSAQSLLGALCCVLCIGLTASVWVRLTLHMRRTGSQNLLFPFSPRWTIDAEEPNPVGLSTTEVLSLPPAQVYKGVEDDTCCICLENLKLDDSYRRLECDHQFHDVCIVRWLNIRKTCPLCITAV